MSLDKGPWWGPKKISHIWNIRLRLLQNILNFRLQQRKFLTCGLSIKLIKNKNPTSIKNQKTQSALCLHNKQNEKCDRSQNLRKRLSV